MNADYNKLTVLKNNHKTNKNQSNNHNEADKQEWTKITVKKVFDKAKGTKNCTQIYNIVSKFAVHKGASQQF